MNICFIGSKIICFFISLMQISHFKHIPCGESFPAGNPHAISVSLPRMADVVGYEEQDPTVLQQLQAGYPRFFMNPLVKQVLHHVRQSVDLQPNIELIPVASAKTVRRLEQLLDCTLTVIEKDGLSFIAIDSSSCLVEPIRKFLQHSGLIISSRRAETYLVENKIIVDEFVEPRMDNADSTIRNTLAGAYGHLNAEDVILCNSGMTANYGVFSALKALQSQAGRHCFVQFGWLYTDTMEIIKKYSQEHFLMMQIHQLGELEQWLRIHHTSVAAIFTEVPNNPMMQFVDLPELYRMAKKYNIPLVVDGTLGTPFNIELLSYADIAIESLTKFACGTSSLLMGGVMLRSDSVWAQACKELIVEYNEPPYLKKVEHLGACIGSYAQRVDQIAENTLHFNRYLNAKKQVKQVFSAQSSQAFANFCKIRKSEKSMPGIVSVVFDKPLAYYYDSLMLSKGPSLGNNFTLAMPYFYLAHWDLVNHEAGRKALLKLGLEPELLRISIGLEPIDQLIGVFENVFDNK